MSEINDYELKKLQDRAADADSITFIAKAAGRAISLAIIVIVGVVIGWKLISPELNLRKANTEKQAVIKEQEANSKAAEFEARSSVTRAQAEADARVIEAKGIRDSNSIIQESITPEWLEYLRIQNLGIAGADVIYVPVGADGLPLAEAGRALAETEDTAP